MAVIYRIRTIPSASRDAVINVTRLPRNQAGSVDYLQVIMMGFPTKFVAESPGQCGI
jgi:hypothetical protein